MLMQFCPIFLHLVTNNANAVAIHTASRVYSHAVHTAGWRTKNRCVNICIYVNSLRLLAATSPTAVVAHW